MTARGRTTGSPASSENPGRHDGQRIPRDALASFPPLPELPLVSIAVPALNEEAYVGGLIDSIEAQDYPRDRIELIIADGGSTDHTREIIAERARQTPLHRIVLVDNPARTTPHGRNACLPEARGEVIVALEAHADVAPDFVRANVEALRTSGAAATGGPIETVGAGRTGRAVAAAMTHPFGVGDARFRYATTAGDVDTIAFAAYRRECFDLLGGFDPERVDAEDGHFNFRVRQAGGRLYLDPAIRSRYYPKRTYAALWRQYVRYGRGKARAIVAEPALGRPRHAAPAAMVGGAALLALAGLRWGAARALLGALGAAYLALGGAAARRAATRAGDPGLAPATLIAFPVMHVAYGLGSIRGAIEGLRRRR